MLKRIFLLICFFTLFSGCSNKDFEDKKILLDESFYGQGDFIDIKNEDLGNVSNKNYILFVYNNFCSLPIPCQDIFKEYMQKYKISFLSINIDEYKKTIFYEKVKYAPTILIISNGKIIKYLDAESNADLNKYQDIREFESWINNYILIKK